MKIPATMQPTLDQWKKNLSLGEGLRFSNPGSAASYETMMDQVLLADGDADDAAPERGVILSKADGEELRYQGDKQVGSLEAVCADGRVVALNFSPQAVDFLQLTARPDGLEALHEHFDRSGQGKNYMQVGGALTVIDMDQPGALGEVFGLNPAPAPGLTSENAAQMAQLGQSLASKLQVPAESVKLVSYERKGFNGGDCGFPVAGELQMSAWTEGLEVKWACEDQKYVYRGLDASTGRYGVDDSDYRGYWKQDERGIFVPDPSAASLDEAW